MSDDMRLNCMSTPELLNELDRMLSGESGRPNVLGARKVARKLRSRVDRARKALETPHGAGNRGHGYELARLGLS